MKARWSMECECCKGPILVGSQYRTFHGRPWRVDHLVAYQRKRRLLLKN